MIVAAEFVANGWMVALAALVLAAVVLVLVFVATTGRGIKSKLVTIEDKADAAAVQASVAACAVGTPNGQGDLVQMQERTLRELGAIASRLDAGDRRMGRIEGTVGQVAEDVGELRREHSSLAVEVGKGQARLDEHLRGRP